MMFSDAKGHKVVDTSSAATVGKVRAFLVEPTTRRIVALRLRKADTGQVLRWRDITGFGTEAVTIPEVGVITDPDAELEALSGKAHALLKKRVLTTGGNELGTVRDVEFDPESGALTTIVLEGAEDVAAQRLVGIGSYAVVVREVSVGS
jgi:sporulation protein YlmC with PRC-barrel domain